MPETSGCWLLAWAADIAPRDLVRLEGAEQQVITRIYPDKDEAVFTVRFPSGPRALGNLERVEIWDPDGTVATRVQTRLEWQTR